MLDFHERSLFGGVTDLWDDQGSLSNNLLRVAESLVSAAAHMLARGKLHMDIKGDNVRISDKGVPVIIDFGSCVDYSPVKDSVVIPTTLTGNLAHLAPEVKRAIRKGAAISGDKQMSFAIGVLLAECLDPGRDHPYEEYEEGHVPTRENLAGWGGYVLSKYPEQCREDGILSALVRVVHDMILVEADERVTVKRAGELLEQIRLSCVEPSEPDLSSAEGCRNPTGPVNSPPPHVRSPRSEPRNLSGKFASPVVRGPLAPVGSPAQCRELVSPRSIVVGHTVPSSQRTPVKHPLILEHKSERHEQRH